MSENTKCIELKECEIPYLIAPQYNKDCSELIFFFSGSSLSEIKFKNYFLYNNGKPTTNYKSIHFIINGKELNEEEIQNFSFEDNNNELFFLFKNNKEMFNMYYHIKVVLNQPIHQMYNNPQLFLTRIIQTNQEIKYL